LDYPDVQRLDRYQVPADFRERSKAVILLWWLVRDTLFLCSPQNLYGFRAFLLRLFGARVGRHTAIRPTARITYPWSVTIGDYVQIGDFAELYSLGPITIGDHAVVSQKSYLCAGSHDHRRPSFDIFARPIVIAPQAWVAADCFIGPGVTVGFGAVIAARSTLMKDAPALKILSGNPARVTGDRTPA
jgi:putative colanic acid biosynthesis acetyltransferase WcaF